METPYGEIPDRFAQHMRPQEMHDYLKNRYGRRTVLKGAPAAVGTASYTTWYGNSSGNPSSSLTSGDGHVSGDSNTSTFDTSTDPFLDVWEVSGTVEPGTAAGAPSGASGVSSGGSTENDPAYVADAPFSSWRYATWSHLTVTVTAPTTSGGTTSMLVQGVDANVSPTVVMDSVTIIRSSVVQPPAATPEIGAEDLLVVAGGAVLGAGVYAAHRKAQRERIFVSGQAPLN
jgi:hypothetical protein